MENRWWFNAPPPLLFPTMQKQGHKIMPTVWPTFHDRRNLPAQTSACLPAQQKVSRTGRSEPSFSNTAGAKLLLSCGDDYTRRAHQSSLGKLHIREARAHTKITENTKVFSHDTLNQLGLKGCRCTAVRGWFQSLIFSLNTKMVNTEWMWAFIFFYKANMWLKNK